MVLQFSEFETEASFDTVQILAGGKTEESSVSLATISGSRNVSALRNFVTGSNLMIVKFRSDASVEKRGFRASWKTEPIKCGGELFAATSAQVITSPLYPEPYPGGLECVYVITAPQGKLVTLEVVELDLDAQKDFILVRDGPGPEYPTLAKLTGSEPNKNKFIVSTGNRIYLYLQTSYGSTGKRGFALRFRSGCEIEYQSESGNITSPAFGVTNYPTNQVCVYRLARPGGGSMSIKFDNFNVSPDDQLQLYDGPEMEQNGVQLHPKTGFSGQVKPTGTVLTASSGKLSIAFKSNALNSATGWSAMFSADCPPLKVGRSAISSSRDQMFGAKVAFGCPTGQEFSNGLLKIETECLQGGRWSVPRIPDCQERYCGPVPQIDNGFAVAATNVTYRGMATYQCYAGFGFASGQAVDTIRCGEDGKWERLPTCLASQCRPIGETPHAKQTVLSGTGRNFGTIIRFECEPGYRRTGVPTVLCESVGDWSGPPPTCDRTICPVLPTIENGFILDTRRRYLFGDDARVQCNRGFRLEGASAIKCGPNEQFENVPVCKDIDECQSASACDGASTECTNTPGSYFCKCKSGFEPNLDCRPVGDLGLRNDVIPDNSIRASGTETGYQKNNVRLDGARGWCGAIPRVGENWIQVDLRAPIIVRGFRIQSVSRHDGTTAHPVTVRLQHTNDLTDLFRDYSDLSGRSVQFRLLPNAGTGLSVVNLPIPLEARFVRLLIQEYVVAPCMRVELMGCSRQDCLDKNECLEKNGGCDQRCVNSPGGSSCACNVGYELFTKNGTSGFFLPPTETGTHDGDVYRLNKTCVPRQCPNLVSPENGQILSTKSRFSFGDRVLFKCDFGYVPTGPTALLCTSNGVWNGTAPECQYANCPALPDDPGQGLQTRASDPELLTSKRLPFLSNETLACLEDGRTLRGTRTSGFRQCVFDPSSKGDFWMAGAQPSCPKIDCGKPPETPGATYGFYSDTKYKSSFFFGCEETFTLAGKTSRNDNVIRCGADGTWDFGDLRCEGPVCSDPGRPAGGSQVASSFEQGSQVFYQCDRPGYVPYSGDPSTCTKNAECKVIRPLGITSGLIPDSAINASTQRSNYEARNIRMGSVTGWCSGNPEPFTFVSVDLGKVHRVTGLMVKGVITNDVVGRPTDIRMFYKTRESDQFVVYVPNFNLTKREPGNYGELTVIELPTAVVARHVTVGVVSYHKNMCMKLELLGCEETKETVLLGYDKPAPMCVDHEPPTFLNCPDGPLVVGKSPAGLLPINFTIPMAVDNSGFVVRTEVKPQGFKPPQFVFKDTVVEYFAYDMDGNVAVCMVNITVPDDTPPTLECPKSFTINLTEQQDTYLVDFNDTRAAIKAFDASGDVTLQMIPETALVPLNGYRNVTVIASDRFGNEAICHFQVSVEPNKCTSWSIVSPANGQVNCLPDEDSTGFRCLATCNSGYRFTDGDSVKTYECASGKDWVPSPVIPDCVPEDTAEASYDVIASVDYRAGGFLTPSCLEQYVNYVSTYYPSLNQILSDRCSAINVKMDIRFFNTTGTVHKDNELTVSFVLRVEPTIKQPLLYELCGSTLGLIFDLSVPSTSVVIEPILNISAAQVGGSCPSLSALTSKISRGFGCVSGEVLNMPGVGPSVSPKSVSSVPRCLHCPAGTFADGDKCISCPTGYYQDATRQSDCRQCPEGFYTKYNGSKSLAECVPVCGFGTYSASGLVPCMQCAANTFNGRPPIDGFKTCTDCTKDTFTYGIGASSSEDCKAKCPAGTYSETGLEPCSVCPVHYYQEKTGATNCSECKSNERTLRPGALSMNACAPVNCSSLNCKHGGICLTQNHDVSCYCPAGFTGPRCETDINECDSQPCFNGAQCIDHPQGYTCRCPPGYSGIQCQNEVSECSNSTCPDRAMCQDVPGRGTVNCLCRSGYEGPSCNITSDPCQGEFPCDNEATCIPLLQGRYKCQCPAGWTGRRCEVNIDDCSERPCLLGANCTDLVNDFKCDCPTGFTGKRCETKINLCSDSAGNPRCLNGECIDRLYSAECVCNAGWSGDHCEINVDDCAASPCKNGGQCVDQVDGFKCECEDGYTGSRCQHEVDTCEENPCQNGGSCFKQQDGFMCLCRPGFVGLQCEAKVDECAANPCAPTGTASCSDLDNGFRCDCHTGFTGEFCESNINECTSSPCLNGATCTDNINGYHCICPPGWSGDRCDEDVGLCSTDPCFNNAKCIDLFQDYFCVCPSGTDGKRCQTSPQRCIGSPCQHGGACQDFGSGLNCTCPSDKYTGNGCEYEHDPCDSCANGATCLPISGTDQVRCACAPGYTGKHCDRDIANCGPNSYCRKSINIDYDLHINDERRSSSAALAVPFELQEATSFSVGIWVQYNNADGQGQYFTLYEVDSAHVPSGKRPIISADHAGVMVSILPDVTSVFIPYLKSVPINDGQWHHIVISWSSVDGKVSLVTDTAVAGAADYVHDGRLPSYGWVVLGAPVNAEGKSMPMSGFHGKVSRVNMWSRPLDQLAEIPAQYRSCKNAPIVFDGLLLRWSGYDKVQGTVERESPGQCGLKVCPTGYTGDECKILQQDKVPPQVLHCPSDLWVISKNMSTFVQWEEPQFVDDLKSVQVAEANNYRPGQAFLPGEYDISYVAVDESGNTARCDFQIHVLREFCPLPLPPVGGERACSDWGPGGRFKVCKIVCNPGMEFAKPVPDFYVCGAEGFWRPTEQPEKSLVFPACAPKHGAQRIFRLGLNFPSSTQCSDSAKKILTSKVTESLLKIDQAWKICSDESRGSCRGLHVNVKCTKVSVARVKRQTGGQDESQDVYVVDVSFPANRDPVTSVSGTEKDEIKRILEQAVYESNLFEVHNTLRNVQPDLNSLSLVTDYACPPGMVVKGSSCVECSLGTHYDDNSQTCVDCPIGNYQNEIGQTECRKCPVISGKQGVTAGEGSRSSNECKERCSPGKYYDEQVGLCRPCGHGFYQSGEGAFVCTPCGPGLTTRSSEAVSIQECRSECEPGLQLSALGNCEPCPVGFFRNKGMPTCEQCPSGLTTASVGSSLRSQCNLEVCQSGHYLNVTLDRCSACPKGTYQESEGRKTSCTNCPVDTTTDDTGATSESHCTNPCLVDGKVELCPANAYCVFHKESQAHACECKPKYRKQITDDRPQGECVYVCDDYCTNGGRCDVNLESNRPRCDCPTNYYGDRCEIKSEFVYIAGGIGAAVIFIIFMVLLIWMICVRTSSPRSSLASLKKMNIHAMGGDYGHGPQPNFYYGAPAPYAESIAPSHHSTYAHYYDDDDDGWEMPNFYSEGYLKDALHGPPPTAKNGSTLQGISNPSIYGTKPDDLYDRLRRHQYTGETAGRPKGDSTSDSEDQGGH
ncbi:Fibropellin-1 [Halotydeus destructor]|nr:Fibropellin-1 [Halotydeus destructor]